MPVHVVPKTDTLTGDGVSMVIAFVVLGKWMALNSGDLLFCI